MFALLSLFTGAFATLAMGIAFGSREFLLAGVATVLVVTLVSRCGR